MPSSSNPTPEVALEPQWYYSSCWAASLAMAARMLAPDHDKLNQCYFIHKKENEAGKCGCLERIGNPLTGKIIETPIYLTKNSDCEIYDTNTGTADSEEVEKLAREITEKTHRTPSPVPLWLLQKKTGKGEPVIFYYSFADLYNNCYGDEHICLIHAIETLERHEESPQFLVAVKDPWPIFWGTEYYMSYESYSVQPGSVNICLWDKADPQLSVEHSDATYIHENKRNMGDEPEKAAENVLITLKYMLDNNKNIRFLKKIGLSTQNEEVSLSVLSYQVHDVGSTMISINNNLNQISIENLDNTRDFKKRIYFLVQNNKIRTAMIVFKSIEKNHYDSRWFLHTLENGERYQKAIQKLSKADAANTEDLVLFRITGDINGEMLLKLKAAVMTTEQKKDRADYIVISRIRFDD